MYNDIDIPRENKRHKRFKEPCQSGNCIRRATVQVSINLSNHRIVRIKVCKKCLRFFQDDQTKAQTNNTLTSDKDFSRETDPTLSFIIKDVDWKFSKGLWRI
jgi:hypothetical protein